MDERYGSGSVVGVGCTRPRFLEHGLELIEKGFELIPKEVDQDRTGVHSLFSVFDLGAKNTIFIRFHSWRDLILLPLDPFYSLCATPSLLSSKR
ncbi:MAG: hypothetical protein AB7W37_05585 [Syntrophobacteraceae bacterium]